MDEGEDGELVDGNHGAVSANPAKAPTAGGDATMVDETEHGDLENEGHGACPAAPTTPMTAEGDSALEKLETEFNIKEFLELASRVIDDGDSESLEVLKKLKNKWTKKLGGEFSLAGNGGFRPVKTRPPTPFPAHTSRPARRGFLRQPTEKAAHFSAAPTSGFVEPQQVKSPRGPFAALTFGASTAASPRSLAQQTSPTPSTAGNTMVAEHGASPTRPNQTPVEQLKTPGESPLNVDIWAPSAPTPTVNVQPFAGSKLGLNEPLHQKLPEVSSSPIDFVQPAVTRPPPQTGDRVELPQHHAATATLPRRRSALGRRPPHRRRPLLLRRIHCRNFLLVIVRPSIDMIRAGSKRWNTTAVGYFLGKKPYFHHLNEFVRSIWPGVRDVKATSNGFFFFQFNSVADMEEVIEGGPWLYLGQPIVLQKWEPGSKLPKHVVIMMPNELGGESACKVDVEYEWLPPKCTGCSSLGHSVKECPLSKPMKPAVSLYVRKAMPPKQAAPELKMSEQSQVDPSSKENQPEIEDNGGTEDRTENGRDKGKDIVLFNAFDILRETDDDADGLHSNATRIQSGVLYRWRWFVDYAGPGNRIWIAWNDELIDVDILNVDTQYVHCRVHFNELHETILITVVYGANDVSTRRDLWQGLIELADTVDNEPWLVGGDFNAVLDMSEVSGASGDIRGAMNEFNDCILQTGLLALPMQGERFTWHNCSLDGRSLWKRLDRLLANDVWMDKWPNMYYSCLTPRTSDHSPLVLKGDCRNLQLLSRFFRQQRRCKGDLAMNVKLAADFLEVAQNILQLDRHNSLLLLLEHCCRLVYLKASKIEQNLLGGDRTDRAMDLQYLRPWARHILTDEEARTIIRPVTIDEVKTAFFDIEEDKAPGPDGFSSGFFKAAWPVVGDEVSNAIRDFFKTGRLLKQLNATLLTLIPKVRNPQSVAEFRPISCCNVIYKAITKILVSRIREILDLLISPSQNAFVPGRLISDNILLAQELFSGYNQCRLPPRCALKVDLRKAYDTVEWDFLFATLRMFGFPAVFIGWIKECVTSAHYSVVVNGGAWILCRGKGSQTGRPHVPIPFCPGYGSPSHDLAIY
ncbi:UNVERIFIED_CONTAM: hypothetical protein Sradi_7089600 [Sesamum radiatum]|uniref:Reverse transcriptase domain-containing protein n=1 Tax=Sesamum radiatum TaxID=300843 RepID=A0AAW2J3S8_SESRA